LNQDRVVNAHEYEKTLNHLVCPICLNILWDPVSCSNCQINYCRNCIYGWLKKQNNGPPSCPNRCNFVQISTPPIIKDLLSGIVISCINENKGCKEKINYDELSKHQKNCKYQEKLCKGCSQLFSFEKLSIHEEMCEEFPVVAPCCDRSFSRKKLKEHDEKSCWKECRINFLFTIGQMSRELLMSKKEMQFLTEENELLRQEYQTILNRENKSIPVTNKYMRIDLSNPTFIDRRVQKPPNYKVCPKNHILILSSSHHYACDGCGRGENSDRSWRCAPCDYDICGNCRPLL